MFFPPTEGESPAATRLFAISPGTPEGHFFEGRNGSKWGVNPWHVRFGHCAIVFIVTPGRVIFCNEPGMGCNYGSCESQSSELQSVMERCSARNHENATADPSAAPQDVSAKGDDATYFQARSFDCVRRGGLRSG